MGDLLRAGADVNAANHVGNSPLHLAVEAGQEESINILLASGSSFSAANMLVQTPLQLARVMGARRAPIVSLLELYKSTLAHGTQNTNRA
jgi:ankyrin repeat protein